MWKWSFCARLLPKMTIEHVKTKLFLRYHPTSQSWRSKSCNVDATTPIRFANPELLNRKQLRAQPQQAATLTQPLEWPQCNLHMPSSCRTVLNDLRKKRPQNHRTASSNASIQSRGFRSSDFCHKHISCETHQTCQVELWTGNFLERIPPKIKFEDVQTSLLRTKMKVKHTKTKLSCKTSSEISSKPWTWRYEKQPFVQDFKDFHQTWDIGWSESELCDCLWFVVKVSCEMVICCECVNVGNAELSEFSLDSTQHPKNQGIHQGIHGYRATSFAEVWWVAVFPSPQGAATIQEVDPYFCRWGLVVLY